jgi:hypothetical protein
MDCGSICLQEKPKPSATREKVQLTAGVLDSLMIMDDCLFRIILIFMWLFVTRI